MNVGVSPERMCVCIRSQHSIKKSFCTAFLVHLWCCFESTKSISTQLETCLEIANIELSQDDLDIMLQCIGLDDDGTVCDGLFVTSLDVTQRTLNTALTIFLIFPLSLINSFASVLFRWLGWYNQLKFVGFLTLSQYFAWSKDMHLEHNHCAGDRELDRDIKSAMESAKKICTRIVFMNE